MKTFVLFALLSFPLFAQDSSGKFLWGAANAAFQVEGSPGDSDWYRFTHTKGKIEDGTNADKATDFWNRYKEDFQIARDTGLNAFRISIAWERIEPQEGIWDDAALTKYEEIITAMRSYGLEPVVTLHHFVLPFWVAQKGGLEAKNFPELFARFSAHVVDRLARGKANVSWWLTFNEPEILVMGGYTDGDWPPGLKDPNRGIQAAVGYAKAHIEAVKRIRALGINHVKVSIAKHWRVFEAANSHPGSKAMTKLLNFLFNEQFTTCLTTGRIFFWMPGAGKPHLEWVTLPEGKSTLDYLGMNQYGRSLVTGKTSAPFYETSSGNGEKNDLGWEIWPDALVDAVKTAYDTYRLPVLITENGLADAKDEKRPRFLEGHFKAMEKIQSLKLPLLGYLHWSLTDNFEWARGLTPRFGLVEIDYANGTRKPRPSLKVFEKLVRDAKKP